MLRQPLPKPAKREPKKRKRMKIHFDQKWAETRTQWLAENEPSFEGYYTCAMCGRAVHVDEVTLDHIVPRSRDSKLKYDMSNLAPMHFACNTKKGSRLIRPPFLNVSA